MRYRQMATAFAFLLSLTAQAVSGSTDRGIDERAVRPGNVGPNSDLNSQVSPTSPNIPTTAQPPPEIAPGNGSTGANTGESGSSGPYNPNPPSRLPQD